MDYIINLQFGNIYYYYFNKMMNLKIMTALINFNLHIVVMILFIIIITTTTIFNEKIENCLNYYIII